MNWSISSLVGFLLPLICMLFGGCRHSDSPIKNIRSEELRESHGVVNEPTEVFSEGSFENHDKEREPFGWDQLSIDSIGMNESQIYFSQKTLELDGQVIELEGYMLNYASDLNSFSFARFEQGSGLFGNMDTVVVVDIEIKKDADIPINQLQKIRGKLKLTPVGHKGTYIELLEAEPVVK